MKILSLVVTLLLITSTSAVAACAISPKGNIHVTAEPEPVVFATNFSLDEISKLSRDTGYVGNGPRLGFYVGVFADTVAASLDTDSEGDCTKQIRIEVRIRLTDRRVEVGRELRRQPCLLSAAQQHYEKKAKADDAVFAQYVATVATKLGTTPLPSVIISSAQALDDASRSKLEQWAQTSVHQSLETFHAARIAAQQAVDTPEEMKRLAEACISNSQPLPRDIGPPDAAGMPL